MSGYPVALTREMQRDQELLEAVADWAMSHAAERSRNRRWAMRLLAAERARRDARRAELVAAITRNTRRLAA
jgi:membrane-bound ClpP family serine protease